MVLDEVKSKLCVAFMRGDIHTYQRGNERLREILQSCVMKLMEIADESD